MGASNWPAVAYPCLPLSAELGRALAEAQALYQRELQLV